ncbi:hypothetical protein Pcinc_003531 [Petrolisthes cinctipes]|uniref:SYO1-like TPR repeats domain-containing protein n=1 Tax=Petrolisthes cinctipes TaxID=88211 RepID=A0AAE1L2F4_PETCI|nr:hypothetical protein Pcinc_003531 [Petrolisthes cinctipes]
MGKMKPRRHRGNRYNPTRVRNNGNNGNNGGDNITTPTPGLNLIHEKLDSVLVEQCICGLNTLASLCMDNDGVNVIITQGGSLVNKVTHMLTHTNPQVRCAAAGTLRNLSVCGTDQVVEVLTQPDVFTRVCVFLRTYRGGDWCPALTDLGRPTPTHLDPVTNGFIHTTHLILNLCEYSDETITQFNHESILDILLQHLDPVFGVRVCVSAAECLLCVSENNPTAASVLLTHAHDALVARTRVSDSSTPQDLRFATTLVGVLININYSDNTTTSCQHILQTLATTLHPDPVLALQRLLVLAQKDVSVVGNDSTMDVLPKKSSDVGSSGVGNNDNSNTNDGSTMEVLAEKNDVVSGGVGNDSTMEVLAEKSDGVGNNDTTANTGVVTVQDLDHLITAQQLALELLSNICCPDDDDDEEEEWDDCESVMEEQTTTTTTTTNIQKDNTTLPPEVVEGLRFHDVFNTALRHTNTLTHTLTLQAAQHFNDAQQLLAKLTMVCVRALVCVQNLASVLDIEDMGGVDNVYTIWMNLATHTFNANNTESELLEAATGAMRGIMDTLSQHYKTTTTTITPNITITQHDLQVILESGQSCVLCSVRGNLAHMVGTLGCLAAHHDTHHDNTHILNTITQFLFKVGNNDPELWVSAEAIDSIIDIYSNDNTDNLANQTNLINQLKVKQNKKVLGEHTALVLTVKDNITHFIKYKSKRLKKYHKK